MYFAMGGLTRAMLAKDSWDCLVLPKSNCNLDISFDSELIRFGKIIFVLQIHIRPWVTNNVLTKYMYSSSKWL